MAASRTTVSLLVRTEHSAGANLTARTEQSAGMRTTKSPRSAHSALMVRREEASSLPITVPWQNSIVAPRSAECGG